MKKQQAWVAICGNSGVQMQMVGPSNPKRQPADAAARVDCSTASLIDSSTIFPARWPDRGITPPFDGRATDDLNHTLSLIEAGAQASRHRQSEAKHVRAELSKLRSNHEALLCRWRRGSMHCQRDPKPLFGPPAQSRIRDDRLAIVVAGMTRSFASAPMLDYWRRLLTTVRVTRREPVVFAALSRESGYRGWSLWRTHGLVRSHNESELRAFFASAKIELRATFFGGSMWIDAARQTCHPALRQALTPPDPRQQAPGNFGFQRRAVALDMLLRYEVETGTSFGHVLIVRPDNMNPPLLDSHALARMWTVRDAVVVVNDQLGVAPRALAGYLLAACVMHRVLYGRAPEAWPNEAMKRLHTSLIKPNSGGLVQPTTFLAYHGCMFAGCGLDFRPNLLPWIDEHGIAHAFAVEPHPKCPTAMLRQLEPRGDLAAAEGDGGGFPYPVGSPTCLGQRENGEGCAEELEHAGLASLAICETLEARRPQRPRAEAS